MRLVRPVLLTSGCVLSVFAAGPLAQSPTAPPQAPSDSHPAFTAGTTAIVVDVVVRDKQGRPVTDLQATDFELYEDNVRQDIGSLALVTPEQMAAPAIGQSTSDASAVTSNPPTAVGPGFIALVFDRLTPEGRALAHKGALAYLDGAQPTDFAGVFLIDQSLGTVQTYTNDRDKVRASLDRVASTATSVFSRGQGSVTPQARGSLNPVTSVTAGAEEAGRAPALSPATEVLGEGRAAFEQQRLREQVQTRMERTYDAMMRDQQGQATTAALLALVDSLGTLPGRKTVVFFAEGIAIPPAVQSQFQSIIATANRANVTIYTVDAAGLRVHSKATETADQIRALGAVGIGDAQRDDRQAYTKDLELNEDLLREDPAAGLGMLAQHTGGFLINNTNDLEGGFRRIDEDRRFHYLLTYAPKNHDFKGEYRRISVKVPARKVAVRARGGYLAVRSTGGPILMSEAPALAILDRSPAPSDIPVRGGAFSFPDPKHPGQVAVLVATKPSSIAFQVDTKTKSFRTDFMMLARVVDEHGSGVLKTSQAYRLTGPADRVDAAKQGEILFFRQPTLSPGTYKLEYVAYDALGAKAGAGSLPFAVYDRPGASFQSSALLLIQRSERVPAAEQKDHNPLYQGDLLLYPNLGTPLRKSVDKTVSFAVTIYTTDASALTAVLVLKKEGTPLGQVPMTLPPADANSRINLASQLPLDTFPPGNYTLEMTVARGTEQEVRTASFTLID
jgi:VWFA-related protein